MTSPSIVRSATPEDKNEIWRLFKLLWSENSMMPIDETKVNWYIDRMLHPENIASDDNGPRGIIGVIGSVGSLEGVIMLGFGSLWYSSQISVDEYLNFVDPNHRASNHARVLIKYAKYVVDNLRKMHPDIRLVIGILSTTRTAAKVRFYEREFIPAGCFFVHPAPDMSMPPPAFYQRGRWRKEKIR